MHLTSTNIVWNLTKHGDHAMVWLKSKSGIDQVIWRENIDYEAVRSWGAHWEPASDSLWFAHNDNALI